MKPFDELSARQRKILRYIDEYTVENGYPPTIREIGEATDTNSTSVVNYNLNKLVEEGYLDREQRVSRGVRLIARIPGGVGAMHRSGVRAADVAGSVPLLGNIAAGQPLPVPGDIAHSIDEDDYIEVTS
ncbi:MAG: winged helix DNA-binding protein, partial [Chloroflexota bacterium]